MQVLKLAIPLTAVLFLGCTSQPPQTQPSPTPSENTQTPRMTPLKAAVEELQALEDKIKGGIDDRGYSVIITKTLPLVQQVSGDAKVVAAVKSAFEGHQLALKFWQCDRIEGYKALHQCRGKVLSSIFAKYPEIEAQAKAVIDAKDPSAFSMALDKEEILQAIWQKTTVDTQVASQGMFLNSSQTQSQP